MRSSPSGSLRDALSSHSGTSAPSAASSSSRARCRSRSNRANPWKLRRAASLYSASGAGSLPVNRSEISCVSGATSSRTRWDSPRACSARARRSALRLNRSSSSTRLACITSSTVRRPNSRLRSMAFFSRSACSKARARDFMRRELANNSKNAVVTCNRISAKPSPCSKTTA